VGGGILRGRPLDILGEGVADPKRKFMPRVKFESKHFGKEKIPATTCSVQKYVEKYSCTATTP
jgi:hypothetical protein